MKITFLTAALLASTASAIKTVITCDDANFKGNCRAEPERDADKRCWNMPIYGRKVSSVFSDDSYKYICTKFFNQYDCKGSSWLQSTKAATVPGFMNDNFWSYYHCICYDGGCI
ncbi:hypothetical protein M011DRAFT_458445 [Sporormia fimetaria CBS 119925]|uniref:Uncharacterized protein n=1 Tax=Sporormia fimetaria CBS 119925 TaxID=1340428 RepID=A0A6A6VER9_9PLEO|nr:hypothetical protein M011DRAFT_458445 [Sporormia fimetaria CBS 119925]